MIKIIPLVAATTVAPGLYPNVLVQTVNYRHEQFDMQTQQFGHNYTEHTYSNQTTSLVARSHSRQQYFVWDEGQFRTDQKHCSIQFLQSFQWLYGTPTPGGCLYTLSEFSQTVLPVYCDETYGILFKRPVFDGELYEILQGSNMQVRLDRGTETDVSCLFDSIELIGVMNSNHVICNTSTLRAGYYQASVVVFGSNFLMGRLKVVDWKSSQTDDVLKLTKTLNTPQLLKSNGFRSSITDYQCGLSTCEFNSGESGRVVLPHMLDSNLYYHTANKSASFVIETDLPFVYVGTQIKLFGDQLKSTKCYLNDFVIIAQSSKSGIVCILPQDLAPSVYIVSIPNSNQIMVHVIPKPSMMKILNPYQQMPQLFFQTKDLYPSYAFCQFNNNRTSSIVQTGIDTFQCSNYEGSTVSINDWSSTLLGPYQLKKLPYFRINDMTTTSDTISIQLTTDLDIVCVDAESHVIRGSIDECKASQRMFLQYQSYQVSNTFTVSQLKSAQLDPVPAILLKQQIHFRHSQPDTKEWYCQLNSTVNNDCLFELEYGFTTLNLLKNGTVFDTVQFMVVSQQNEVMFVSPVLVYVQLTDLRAQLNCRGSEIVQAVNGYCIFDTNQTTVSVYASDLLLTSVEYAYKKHSEKSFEGVMQIVDYEPKVWFQDTNLNLTITWVGPTQAKCAFETVITSATTIVCLIPPQKSGILQVLVNQLQLKVFVIPTLPIVIKPPFITPFTTEVQIQTPVLLPFQCLNNTQTHTKLLLINQSNVQLMNYRVDYQNFIRTAPIKQSGYTIVCPATTTPTLQLASFQRSVVVPKYEASVRLEHQTVLIDHNVDLQSQLLCVISFQQVTAVNSQCVFSGLRGTHSLSIFVDSILLLQQDLFFQAVPYLTDYSPRLIFADTPFSLVLEGVDTVSIANVTYQSGHLFSRGISETIVLDGHHPIQVIDVAVRQIYVLEPTEIQIEIENQLFVGWCKQFSKTTRGPTCHVTEGTVWISFDSQYWTQYAQISLIQQCQLQTVYLIGTYLNLPDFVEYCQYNDVIQPANACQLQTVGKFEVYIGVKGQTRTCGTVEVFTVNITSMHPQMFIKSFTNQHLHLYGQDLGKFDFDFQDYSVQLQLISSTHGYLKLPIITSYEIDVTISYKQVYGLTLSLQLIDQPKIATNTVVSSQSQVQLSGINLFSELQLYCWYDNDFSNLTATSVYQNSTTQYIVCPIHKQSGLINIYSQALAQQIAYDIKYRQLAIPMVKEITQQILSGTSIITMAFDSAFIRDDVQIMIDYTVYHCYRQQVVQCLVTLRQGEYLMKVKMLPDSEQWFDQFFVITVVDLPVINSIAPSVVFSHTPTLLIIKGTFAPLMVKKVIIDEWELDPVFIDGSTIQVETPITDKQYLTLKLQTNLGDSNNYKILYASHLQIHNVSTRFIYSDVESQSIVVQGAFSPYHSYYCFFNGFQVNATQHYSNALTCDVDYIKEQIYEGDVLLELAYANNDARYFAATLVAIQRPLITQTKPQLINIGIPTTITIFAQFFASQQLLIRLQESIIVSATQVTQTSLTFNLPQLDQSLITVELSVDGLVWSALNQVDYTTKSAISLFVQEPPVITSIKPLKFLRSSAYSVIFTGTHIDLLVGCSGVLVVHNNTQADCTFSVSDYQTNYTLQAQSQLHLFDLDTIQIIDFTITTIQLPRYLTSYIQTSVHLDLDKTELGYIIAPQQDTWIKAWFGDHALPVVSVKTYSLVLQSSNIHITTQPLILNGFGFSKITSAVCRPVNTTTWYSTKVISDLQLQCDSPASTKIEVSIQGIAETMITNLKIYEQPEIKNYEVTDKIVLQGTALDQSGCTCSINSIYITPISVTNTQVVCPLVSQSTCQPQQLQLKYKHTTTKTIFIPPNYNPPVVIQSVKPVILHHTKAANFTLILANYQSCYDLSLTCIWSTSQSIGILNWPFVICPIPQIVKTQSLQIKINNVTSSQIANAVSFELGLQVLSVSPMKFVIGADQYVKILLTQDQEVRCLFSIGNGQISVQSTAVRNGLRRCQLPALTQNTTMRIVNQNSILVSHQSQQQEWVLQLITVAKPAFIPKVLLPYKFTFDSMIFDSCLFYKYGHEVETELPCESPSYSTYLSLHVKDTDYYLPLSQITLIQPQLTHVIVKSPLMIQVFLTEQFPGTAHCVQQIGKQQFRSVLDGTCNIAEQKGVIWVQYQQYTTNAVDVPLFTNQTETPFSVLVVNTLEPYLSESVIKVFDDTPKLIVQGQNLQPNTPFNTTLNCTVISSALASCELLQSPGVYYINNTQVIIQHHEFFKIIRSDDFVVYQGDTTKYDGLQCSNTMYIEVTPTTVSCYNFTSTAVIYKGKQLSLNYTKPAQPSYSIKPQIFSCQDSLFTVTFFNGISGHFRDLNWISATEATTRLQCNPNYNLTVQHQVLQIKQFQLIWLSNTQVWLSNNLAEFKLLHEYFDQSAVRVNDNFYILHDEYLSVQGVQVSNKKPTFWESPVIILLTKKVWIGYDNQIVILNAKQSCYINKLAVPFNIENERMICSIPDINTKVATVTADNQVVGLISIMPRPQLQQFVQTHLEYATLPINLKPIKHFCVIATRIPSRRPALVTKTNVTCNLTNIQPGVYQLAIYADQLIATTQLSILKPIVINQTIPHDIYSIDRSMFIVGSFNFNQFQVNSPFTIGAQNNTHIELLFDALQPGNHTIRLQQNSQNRTFTFSVQLATLIVEYSPKLILQQFQTDIAVTIQNTFEYCYIPQPSRSTNNKCILPAGQSEITVGSSQRPNSNTIVVPRLYIEITHAVYSDSLFVYGTGLNQLTYYQKGFVCTVDDGVDSYALSINNTCVQCITAKRGSKVRLGSNYTDFVVQTQSVVIEYYLTASQSTKPTFSKYLPPLVSQQTDQVVQSITPRGVYHYQPYITLQVETTSMQVSCEYLNYSQQLVNNTCTIDLTSVSERRLIRDGLLLTIGTYSNRLVFAQRPVISNAVFRQGIEVTGEYFWSQSKCVVNGVRVDTQYINQTSLLCFCKQPGVVQITINNWQFSQPFMVTETILKVLDIVPTRTTVRLVTDSIVADGWCIFGGINMTQLVDNICAVPVSLYTGEVELTLEAPLTTFEYAQQFTYTYITEVMNLQLSDLVTTPSNPVFIKGFNFMDVNYTFCCSNHTASSKCYPVTYIDENTLQIAFNYTKTRYFTHFNLSYQYHEWSFDSVLVLMQDPFIIGQQVMQQSDGSVIVDFVLPFTFLQHVIPVYCVQKHNHKAWITSISETVQLRCQGLTYGVAFIQFGNSQIPFNVLDWFAPTVSQVYPLQTIRGINNFTVHGYYRNAICLFLSNGQQIYASFINQSQCQFDSTNYSQISLQIWEGERNTLLYQSQISFQAKPVITSINPTWLYHPSYIQIEGTNINNCQCIFGTNELNYTSEPSSDQLCQVPDLNWFYSENVTQVAMQCQQHLSNSIQLQLKAQPEIWSVSNQENIITVIGAHLDSTLLLVINQSAFNCIQIASSKLVCNVKMLYNQTVTIKLRHIHPQNTSDVFESNSIQHTFHPLIHIWYTGQQYLSNPNTPLLIHTSAQISYATCQYKSDAEYMFSPYNDGYCTMPQVLSTGTFKVSLRYEISGQLQYTNWFQIQLVNLPFIDSLFPLYVPAYENSVVTVFGGNLVQNLQIQVGDLLLPLTYISPTQCEFILPNYNQSIVNVTLYNTLHLNVIIRPQITQLIPNHVSQVGSHQITILGRGFTESSLCMIEDSILPTVLFNSSLIQCTITPSDHVGYANTSQLLFVSEQSHESNQMPVIIDMKAYVWKLKPSLIGSNDKREVKVYVSTIKNYRYCQAGIQQVVEVTRVQIESTDCSDHTLDARTTSSVQMLPCGSEQQVYICEFTLPAGSYSISMMDGNGEFATDSIQSITVIERPSLMSVRVPALPFQSTVELQGVNFPNTTLICIFSKKFGLLKYLTNATYVDQSSVTCQLPNIYQERQFAQVSLIVVAQDKTQYQLIETINIIVYPIPEILSVNPSIGMQNAVVTMQADYFDNSLGGIWCKFGLVSVQASVVNNKTITCVAPSNLSGRLPLQISMNNKQNYNGSNSFTYMPSVLNVTTVSPQTYDFTSRQVIQITGGGFPTGSVICLFTSAVNYKTVGTATATQILCYPSKHYQSGQSLFVSFNGQQYHQITTLDVHADNRLRYNMTQYQSLIPITQCPKVTVDAGTRFQQQLDVEFNQDIYMQITILKALQSISTESQFANSIVQAQDVYTIAQSVKIRYINSTITQVEVYQQLYGLYQWLQVQPIICSGDSIMLTIKVFDDPAQLNRTEAKLTCQFGTQYLQDQISRNVSLTVECVSPRFAQTYPPQLFNSTQIIMIEPSFAFIDDINITTYVTTTVLYNITSLMCKFDSVLVPGVYIADGPKIKCTIASFLFLQVTQTNLPENLLIPFEVSLDSGRTFTSSGTKFKILQMDQFLNQWPRVGPASGGTIIFLTLTDFPSVNNQIPQSSCHFSNQTVVATWLNATTVSCVTPPITFQTDYLTTTVKLFMLNTKHVYDFNFVYLNNPHLLKITPQNIYFRPSDTTRAIYIHGYNFLPLIEIYCGLQFSGIFVEVQGYYVNNHTITCNITAPSVKPTHSAILAPLSLSFNGKQQYTDSIAFWYSPQDTIASYYPIRQYVQGNELVQLNYSYFFDYSDNLASCKFQYNEKFIAVKLFRSDSHSVTCMIPPAYLISVPLSGAIVQLSISSNGQDFSAAVPFTYLPKVQILTVYPIFILKDLNVTVTLTGQGFYDNSDTKLLLIRLSSHNATTVTSNVWYDGQVHFTFPSNIFQDKDLIKVELTFDNITWDVYDAQKIVVVQQIQLSKIKPVYSYVNRANNEVYIEAGLLPRSDDTPFDVYNQFKPGTGEINVPRKGAIWPTDLFSWLKCQFTSPDMTYSTSAYFINSTMVGCPLPLFTTAQQVLVDLSFDSMNTFSVQPHTLNVIDEPIISALNSTEYYYTYRDFVYIQISGQNLDSSGNIYVQVQDTNLNYTISSGSSHFAFQMPVGLSVGVYTIKVSTDGIWYLPSDDTWQISVKKCPNGYTCAPYIVTVCPMGTYCPQDTMQTLTPIDCPLGMYQDLTGADYCKTCTTDHYCPSRGLIVPDACPVGWLCQDLGLFSKIQLKECPQGYFCPSGTITLNPNNLFENTNMKSCPVGHFCPKGTADGFSVYANFTTPQACKDGFICGQTIHNNQLSYAPGAIDQFGISECLPGSYCKKGRVIPCPNGFKCPSYQLSQPIPCSPGFYRNDTNLSAAAECDLCPSGTFCWFQGMANPTKCKPGFTCQLDGSPLPSQLCPAGSFCTISVMTNLTNSTLDQKVIPINCFSSTYCLAGAFTPYVDSSNPQAAQECIAGTFCEAGSASPEGKGKCEVGFYCPANAQEMIPTSPGYFAEGTGNVDQEACRPGTYQDENQTSSCKDCPVGSFCPEPKMIAPQPCEPGTYSMSSGLTQCTNCPLGTYSDETGVSSDKNCKQCDPAYVCTQTGLSKMQQAQGCQEGYYCGYGTTTTIMLRSTVLEGFYGGANISNIAQFKLCEKGNYCPPGTATSKVNQLDCLIGYYCPWGTAAELNLDGQFYQKGEDGRTGVHQVDIPSFLIKIQEFVTQTTQYMKEFENQNRTQNLLQTYYNLGNLSLNTIKGRMSAKQLQQYNQLDWQFQQYATNQSIVAERKAYMDQIKFNNTPCPEDSLLPDALKIGYSQNGQMLKCPRGTSSVRQSWCLGQCKIDLNSKVPQAILDPVVAVVQVTSLSQNDPDVQGTAAISIMTDFDLAQRRRQLGPPINNQNRDYSVQDGFVNDTLNVLTIKPLGIAKIYVDFRNLPDLFNYNQHFAIVVKSHPDGAEYTLPYYFSEANDNQRTYKKTMLVIRCFNMLQTDKQFTVGIQLYDALFMPYLQNLSSTFHVEMSQASRQLRGTNYTYAFVLCEAQMDGTTMPYNSVDYGNDPDLWLDQTSYFPDANMTSKDLDKDAFDNTYWQSKQITAVVMPWIPFFSNCDGSDSRIIPYDIFEFYPNNNSSYCNLPEYNDLRVVNPIPTSGLDPVADSCQLRLQCRYDEDLSYLRSSTLRWFEIKEMKNLFYMTQSPVPIENFIKLEDSDTVQTFYNTLIENGSDELLPVQFTPIIGAEGVPRTVQIDFLYYQQTVDVKIVQSVNIYLLDYDGIDRAGLSRDEIPIEYTILINYVPLSYFNLINNFQFSVPIYVVLFMLISAVVILSIMIFWLIILSSVKSKDPPALRFFQLAKITFSAPSTGCFLAVIPVGLCVCLLKYYQNSTLFEDQPNNWTLVGNILSVQDVMDARRGRVGLAFSCFGLMFMSFGSTLIVHKPSEDEEREILSQKQKAKRIEALEMSQEGIDGNQLYDVQTHEKEENVNIRRALDWKRKHFFTMSFGVSILLLLKMEYSYTPSFQNNIQVFLVFFLFLDIINEQLLTRVVMSEALLVAPLQSTFIMTEFVMTMGANDFKQFLLSYVIDTFIMVTNRTYIGPFVERVEAWTQIYSIKLAQKYSFVRKIMRNILIKQMAAQMQLMSLNEFALKKKIRADLNPEHVPNQFEWQMERGEGLEALLGSAMQYAQQTQAIFTTPWLLLLIIQFANETKIAQWYQIRQGDLWYYFTFTLVTIIPQLTIDVFLLHILEMTHGYRTYDYLTYCNYRVVVRTKKWLTAQNLDKSINHLFRSVDGLCFSSQYYFIVSLTSWGVLMIYLGGTAMIRAAYNPFADPTLIYWVIGLPMVVLPVKWLLGFMSQKMGLWKLTGTDRVTVDVATINRLDQANNMKRLLKNITTNPFRNKFVQVNREWIVSNLATILGGRAFAQRQGQELTYLNKVYQSAINAQVINDKLNFQQNKLKQKQMMLPYNQKAALDVRVEVSEDSVSDVLVRDWNMPEQLGYQHCYRLMKMWLDFGRQQLRLKFMVADIVLAHMRSKCQKCSSRFRLQVIQKIDFNSICMKFREQNQGLQFTKQRWRTFYKRRQIFVTLCMECAYIQTLKAVTLKQKNPELQKLMAQNALKQVGQTDVMVAKKLKLQSVRQITYRWIWLARGSLLHKEDPKEIIKREHRQRLLAMNLEAQFISSDSSESDKDDKQDVDLF